MKVRAFFRDQWYLSGLFVVVVVVALLAAFDPPPGARQIPVEQELDGCKLLVASKLYEDPSFTAPQGHIIIEPKDVRCDPVVEKGWYWVIATQYTHDGVRRSYPGTFWGYLPASDVRPDHPKGPRVPRLTPSPCFPAGDGGCRAIG